MLLVPDLLTTTRNEELTETVDAGDYISLSLVAFGSYGATTIKACTVNLSVLYLVV